MEFLLQFDGTLLVRFKPNEVSEQIEFLSSIEPTSEEDSETISRLLDEVIRNNTNNLRQS